jgi:hypothetical protein
LGGAEGKIFSPAAREAYGPESEKSLIVFQLASPNFMQADNMVAILQATANRQRTGDRCDLRHHYGGH